MKKKYISERLQNNSMELSMRLEPAGFTLMELLVSVAVLAIGCLAVMGLQSSSMQRGAQANDLSVASFLIESQYEWLRSLDLGAVELVQSKPEKLTIDGTVCAEAEDCPFVRTTKVLCSYPTSRSCQVMVTVEWKRLYKDYKVDYFTIISADGFS